MYNDIYKVRPDLFVYIFMYLFIIEIVEVICPEFAIPFEVGTIVKIQGDAATKYRHGITRFEQFGGSTVFRVKSSKTKKQMKKYGVAVNIW